MFPSQLEILKKPDARLLQTSIDVEAFGDELQAFAAEMLLTMSVGGGIGLAAPQVGVLQRIIVVGHCPEDWVIVNPIVLERSARETMWPEGCLSCPGATILVKRPKWIRLQWRDVRGEVHDARLSHLDARVVQHEMDHLDGILIEREMM